MAEDDTGPHVVLDGIDFSLEAGEVVDVAGPSGVGKTTLLRALARLLPGATGSLELAGLPAEEYIPAEWRSRVTLLPQRFALVPGTVRDNLLLPWRLKVRQERTPPPDDSALAGALDSVGLASISLDRDVARLSVGQGARVALLRVLLTGPDVLLLDEPDANLDDVSAEMVAEATRTFAQGGGGVVRVRHQRIDGVAARRLHLAKGRLSEASTP